MKSLWNELEKYAKSDIYPMHMPGHKRNPIGTESSYGMDITEIDGFDNLQESRGILQDLKHRAARLYGADESYLLVNGSTVGILAGISACIRKGDKVLMARNCHKSVYNAIFLKEAEPVYLYPDYLEGYSIHGSISSAAVSEKLEEHSDIRLVVIVSPTYEGIVSDIAAIAREVHKKGISLFVDEAHGSHFGFCDYFPNSAVKLGADLVVQSVHKTLPGLTQSALLHRIGDRIDGERLHQYINRYQTSSPSYLLMSSIDRSMHLLEKKSDELMGNYQKRLEFFYQGTKALHNLRVIHMNEEKRGKQRIFEQDFSKIIISTKYTNMTGNELCCTLRKSYRIQMEMESIEYALGMTSICDTWAGFFRLLQALKEIDSVSVYTGDKGRCIAAKEIPEQVFLPWETEYMEGSYITPDEGEGFVSLAYLYVYPPGSPFLVSGERISRNCVEKIHEYLQAGFAVHGLDEFGRIKIAKVE